MDLPLATHSSEFDSLLLSILIFLPTLASADHGPPSVSSPDELVLQLSERFDDLADEYFLAPGEQPNFDGSRFNRRVGTPRLAVERARPQVTRGRVCLGMRWLSRSVWLLDRATRFAIKVNMSDSGFSDDLASSPRAIAEITTKDLLVLAASAPGVPPLVLTIALALKAQGEDLQSRTLATGHPSCDPTRSPFTSFIASSRNPPRFQIVPVPRGATPARKLSRHS
jgi:hypothetical protein